MGVPIAAELAAWADWAGLPMSGLPSPAAEPAMLPFELVITAPLLLWKIKNEENGLKIFHQSFNYYIAV